LTPVIRHSSTDASTVRLTVVVVLALVVLRPLWMFPATAVARSLQRRRQVGVPLGWRETTVASWAGMRGIVTVATALALPHRSDDGAPLGWREEVVLVALVCVLVTLVVQGLTLTPLVQRLKVGADTDEAAEITELQMEALRAALESLRADAAGTGAGENPGCAAAILQYEGRLNAYETMRATILGTTRAADGGVPGGSDDERAAEVTAQLRQALQRGNDVEREVVLRARAEGQVSPAAADEVLNDIEVRAARSSH
jgi:CPA1 family monovalent cation:H+ antiporter